MRLSGTEAYAPIQAMMDQVLGGEAGADHARPHRARIPQQLGHQPAREIHHRGAQAAGNRPCDQGHDAHSLAAEIAAEPEEAPPGGRADDQLSGDAARAAWRPVRSQPARAASSLSKNVKSSVTPATWSASRTACGLRRDDAQLRPCAGARSLPAVISILIPSEETKSTSPQVDQHGLAFVLHRSDIGVETGLDLADAGRVEPSVEPDRCVGGHRFPVPSGCQGSSER